MFWSSNAQTGTSDLKADRFRGQSDDMWSFLQPMLAKAALGSEAVAVAKLKEKANEYPRYARDDIHSLSKLKSIRMLSAFFR